MLCTKGVIIHTITTMIVRSDIPEAVLQVGEELEKAGFEAYLVGGCVRDLLIGKTPKDWDYTTSATPEEIQNIFFETYCNNDYGTVGVVNEHVENPSLKVVEVTPYRAEGAYSDARRPDIVRFGVSLEEDLKRRDFTVNAIAFRPQNEEMVDIFEGIKDIAEKRLKTVGNPDERFSEDALRMMRAVRLASELGFTIESETMASIAKNSNILSRISTERIRDEFVRIMESKTPMQGIVFLEKLGLIDFVLPELREGIGCEQNQAHAFDVYEHLLRTAQAAADKDFSTLIRISALLHDIGKPRSRQWGKEKKDWTFHGHEVIGAKMSREILKRLKFDKETGQKIVNLVRWHMFFSDPDQVTLSAVRRTITNVGEDHIEDLLNLRICDRIGTGRPKEQPFRFRKYKAMVDQALRDPISVKMLKINGDKIMDITGEKPGKKLGFVLHILLEEVLENPEKNLPEYLETRATELMHTDENVLENMALSGKRRIEEEERAAITEIERRHKVG